MSARTRQNRLRKPGVAANHRPKAYDRRLQHRKIRRAAQVELQQLSEPENHALPRPVHTSMKADPSERPGKVVRSRRFKVWKTKGWKRRSALRTQKAKQYEEFVRNV